MLTTDSIIALSILGLLFLIGVAYNDNSNTIAQIQEGHARIFKTIPLANLVPKDVNTAGENITVSRPPVTQKQQQQTSEIVAAIIPYIMPSQQDLKSRQEHPVVGLKASQQDLKSRQEHPVAGLKASQQDLKSRQEHPVAGLKASQQDLKSRQEQPLAGFNTKGTINSLISTPRDKWIATGNWSMNANNGALTFFQTNMTWFNKSGNATHTHEFLNFRPTEGRITIQPGNTISLKGIMDVGTNHRVVWKNVDSAISVNNGKTITISLNDKQTNSHFAGQPILGIVSLITRCSDVPLQAMEVLPSCGPS
jgi:hypothetical protein